jgi:GNAT superfamily N-acetyltransferase
MTASYALAAYLDFPRIRRARPEDLEAIGALQADSLRALGRAHYDRRVIDLFLEHVGALDPQAVEEGTYWVAERAGRLVGACGFTERPPRYAKAIEGPPVVGHRIRARIHPAFVHPQFVRKGIGRALMAGAEGAVRARGHRAVALDTTLAGLPLCVAMGYRRFAPVAARLPGGASLDLVHMRKELVRTARARAA